MMNGYNFTERVRKVLSMAREEAGRLHHEYVGTEHLLLGMLREGEGVGVTVLQNAGIDVDRLASKLEASVKHGETARSAPDLPYTSRAKKVLELAMDEARGLNHSYVGTEHLLLGMLREEKGIAAQVLVDSGLTLEAAHSEILMILGDESKRPAAERSSSMQRRMAWLGAATVESYPQRVRTVLDDARALAARLGAANVEPSHVAIALLRNGDGAANVALERMRSDATQILASLESTVPTGRAASSPEAVIQRSPALQRGLIAASQEQREWGAAGIGTHHLLIGILASDVDVASAFAAGGVTVDRFREEARRVVG